MGRSENSQNRCFVLENNVLKTTPHDPEKCKDPSLIIYHAMRSTQNVHIVSNGDQTDTILTALISGNTFEKALATRTFEPDVPNYTPRISGIVFMESAPYYKLNILKSLHNNPKYSQNQTFAYNSFVPGFGHCIHTYQGNGDPLPSYSGEPYLVPVKEMCEENADFYWDILNKKTRISLAVKSIDLKNGKIDYKIINKLEPK